MPRDQSHQLPFWLVNVPRAEWPGECPPYLRSLSQKDETHLAVLDADYRPLAWEDVKRNVASGRLDAFFRLPSELRRYRKYCYTLDREYGSVMNFMLQERLGWSSLEPESQLPFACKGDYKVLLNDWPYGIDPRIVHIVVWTKTLFPADSETGGLTPDAAEQIDGFVRATFGRDTPSDNLIWFKNPISLRSVRAVEHFHVMLYDPHPLFVKQVTHGDVPMSQKAPQSNASGLGSQA